MVVFWSNTAITELKNAYDYITLDSEKNAKLFTVTILNLTENLSKHPEKYPLDKFKNANDGSWRAFEKFNYRISYRIKGEQIRIVRFRHVSKSPLIY